MGPIKYFPQGNQGKQSYYISEMKKLQKIAQK